jgi:hypothetical protein
LEQVEAHDTETDRYFAELGADPSHRRRKTKPADFPDALEFFSDSTVVAAAMAVEGFLNLYGVIRLGESFYEANYERLSPPRKVGALLGTCCGVLIQKDNEIIHVTERIFLRRNSLVHPKTRELFRSGPNGGAPRRLPQQIAHESVIDMERFSALFTAYDGDALDLGGI